MSATLSLWVYLIISLIVFFIGLLGILIRKNILILLMCIELMLNAINLAFVAFSKMHNHVHGQVSVFFIMTVAAAESAVGLSLIIALFRTTRSVHTDQVENIQEVVC